jgi:hypothetical protein
LTVVGPTGQACISAHVVERGAELVVCHPDPAVDLVAAMSVSTESIEPEATVYAATGDTMDGIGVSTVVDARRGGVR